jgi:hypothetical protein
MLRYHMAVVTRDNALKREVKRVTTATGSTADFIGDASGLDPKKDLHLAIFDARETEPNKLFFDKVGKQAKIQYILRGDALVDRIHYLSDERVTSLMCHDARFDDDEFIASATKALRGEVFGLQKYFPWGVTTFTMQIKSYPMKTRAIDVLLRYAKLAGVRGPVRDRIQLVCDELMMNALYHAPTDDDGKELFAGKSVKEMAKLEEVPTIEVQYGCSGRYFGVSVRDGGGSLTRERVLEYLKRAKSGAAHIENKAGGAGLGLISVLRSVSKLIINIDPGYSTEVIAIFDMELFAKGKVGARSLHLFSQAPAPEEEEIEEEVAAAVPAVGASAGKWIFIVFLMMVVSAMLTAYVMKRGDDTAEASPPAAEPVQPTLTVHVSPSTAKPTITLNGAEMAADEAMPLDSEAKSLQIKVEAPKFRAHTQTLDPSTLGDRTQVWVNLLPKRGSR